MKSYNLHARLVFNLSKKKKTFPKCSFIFKKTSQYNEVKAVMGVWCSHIFGECLGNVLPCQNNTLFTDAIVSVYKPSLPLSAATVPGFNNSRSLSLIRAAWFLEGLQLISQWWAVTPWQPDEWYWHGRHLTHYSTLGKCEHALYCFYSGPLLKHGLQWAQRLGKMKGRRNRPVRI